MTTLELQKKIAPILPKGESLAGFMKNALLLQLQEVNKKIAVFEGKYNKEFQQFKTNRPKLKKIKKYSYEIEGDYMDWEALEDYKRDLMRVAHSI